MKNSMQIRGEAPTDADGITRVNYLAFGRPNEGELILKLRKLSGFEPRLSLVYEKDNIILGYILLLPIMIQSTHGDYQTLSLGPIAVLPDHQKRGIGGCLIGEGHAAALELGFQSVVLLGHPTYYPRFGYKPAALWNLTNPWGIHNEAFMAIELIKGTLDNISGLVIYPKVFNDSA
jgi:putative acetyltransferase